jgi:hypothetical protein
MAAGPACGSRRGTRLRAIVPVHKDRSRIHEARIAGLAIVLSVVAMMLVVVYVLAGFVGRVTVRFG